MKKLIVLLSCILAVITVSAQVTEIGSLPASDTVSVKASPAAGLQQKKVDWGVQLGTSATFAGKYGSGFSTYVSPHVTWQPSKRFRVNAGVSIVNTTLTGYHPYYYGYGFESGSYSGNYTHALLYAEGEYLLSEKLILGGSIYADLPLTGSDPKNPFSTSSFKGASMNLQYRIGEHATIQAGFNYIRSDGPYRYDPFMAPGSFNYDPFGNRFADPFNH